jgi:hypothetical protein
MGRGVPQNGMAVDADRQKDFPALPSYASYELGSLAQAFEVARTADDVADASQKLNSTIQQITANSEGTSAQANVASNAAQPVEEQNTTTNGMSRNVSDAARRSAVAARSPVTLRRSGSDRKHITGRRGTRRGNTGVGRRCRCNWTVGSSDSRLTPTKIGAETIPRL